MLRREVARIRAVSVVYIVTVIWTLFSFVVVGAVPGPRRVRRQDEWGESEEAAPSKPCQFSDAKTGLCFRLGWAEDLGEPLTYEKARGLCLEFGASLAMPGNQAENRYVMSLLKNESLESVWLAARRQDNPWSWRAGQSDVKIIKDQGCFEPPGADGGAKFLYTKVERTEFSAASCVNACGGYSFAALRKKETFECGCSEGVNGYASMGTWLGSCPYRCSTSDLQCSEDNTQVDNLRVFHVSGVDGLQWSSGRPTGASGECGGIDRDGELHMLPCSDSRNYICTNGTGLFASGEMATSAVAGQRCRNSGGLLAYFSNEGDATTFLDSISMKSDDRFWVDVTRFSWQWVTGSDSIPSPVRFSRWSSESLAGTRCAVISSQGEWVSKRCNEVQLAYLCQKGGVVTTEKQKSASLAAATRNGIIAGVVLLVVLIFIIGVIVYKCKQGHDIDSVSDSSPRKLRESLGPEDSEPDPEDDSPEARRFQIVHPHRPAYQEEEEDIPEPNKTEEPIKPARPVPPPKPPKPIRPSESTGESPSSDTPAGAPEPPGDDSVRFPVYAVPNKGNKTTEGTNNNGNSSLHEYS